MAMMDTQLNAWMMFAHAPDHFADTEIVTKIAPGNLHRYTYADFGRRAQMLMHALDRLGVGEGERVATLAWNTYRHLECYFAVPCTGRVLHTLNLRLSVEDLTYIIGHADDRVILADPDMLPILEKIGDGLANVEHIIVLDDTIPDTSLPGVLAYEELIADEPDHYPPRRDLPETTPLGICYTSGTTGRPKAAVYTHRSTVLHSFAASSAAGVGIGPQDCVLPIVPMFHANAWGFPHAATMVGAKQVFTGRHLDPESIVDLIEGEDVTISGGVPTIWLSVIDELAKRGKRPERLRHLICGGSQPPRALIERYMREFNIPIVQAWGMTETNPLASIAWPKEKMRDWADDRLTSEVRTQAGLPVPGIDVSVRDADGEEVPADGKSMGELLVRGPWVIDSYLYDEDPDRFTKDGWFRTGDVAIRSPEGYFVIADRTKDLIKSGGEWISSVDMEGHLMAMPEVLEACVVAIPDEKWQERPLACVVPRPGETVTLERVREHLASHGWAKWQLPDRIEIIEVVPRTTVGKFDKKVLRSRFA